jgi:hypothetical protein
LATDEEFFTLDKEITELIAELLLLELLRLALLTPLDATDDVLEVAEEQTLPVIIGISTALPFLSPWIPKVINCPG